MIGLIAEIALALTGLTLAFAIGYRIALGTRDRLIDDAAAATLDLFLERQAADDRTALETLPPTVTRSDAIDYAARRGLGIREAAGELFRHRARAVIDQRIHERERRP